MNDPSVIIIKHPVPKAVRLRTFLIGLWKIVNLIAMLALVLNALYCIYSEQWARAAVDLLLYQIISDHDVYDHRTHDPRRN